MDDAFLVCGIQCIGDLARVVERGLKWQRPFRRFPFDQLHHEVVGTDIVQRADVGVVQRGDGPCLALEPVAEVLARHLDGDIAPDTRVVRAIDDTHAAGANLRDDLVGAEPVAGGRLHPR